MPRGKTSHKKPKNPELRWRGEKLHYDFSIPIKGHGERRFRGSTGTDNEKLAGEFLAREKERRYREGVFKEKAEIALEEAFIRYWLDYGAKQKSHAIAYRLKHYKEFFIRQKKLPYLSAIDDSAIAQYVQWRRIYIARGTGKKGQSEYIIHPDRKTSDETIRKEVHTLHHLIAKHAPDLWKVKVATIKTALHTEQLAGSKQMANHLDQAQVAEFLSHLPAFLQPPLEFVLLTGLRAGNVWNFKSSQIIWDRDTMRFSLKTPRKEPKILDLPIVPRVREILYSAGIVPTLIEERHVFLQDSGEPLGDHRKAIDTAFKKAGIKRLKGQRVHLLRHTAGTHLYDLTRDIVAVKEILGHSDIQTTMVYAHLVEDKKKAALEVHSSSQIRHKDKEGKK